MLVCSITGFEESEGDAFYGTIEENRNQLKKTLIIVENESESDRLVIDGRISAKSPANYDKVALKGDQGMETGNIRLKWISGHSNSRDKAFFNAL